MTQKIQRRKRAYTFHVLQIDRKKLGVDIYLGRKKKDMGNNMDNSNLLLCVKIHISQIYAVRNATSGKRLLTENNLISQQKSIGGRVRKFYMYNSPG